MAGDGLVQQILVEKNRGTHEEVCLAVALASGISCVEQPKVSPEDAERWQRYLAGGFTKTVRRASKNAIHRAMTGPQRTFIEPFGFAVAAFIPMTLAETPKEITKQQVSDYEREHNMWSSVWNIGYSDKKYKGMKFPAICINPHLEMSTGKAAAQAAHGMMSWAIKYGDTKTWERWDRAGNPTDLCSHEECWLQEEGEDPPEIEIVDAGLTEIAPNSKTVIVRTIRY